jgi:hypothetical protein
MRALLRSRAGANPITTQACSALAQASSSLNHFARQQQLLEWTPSQTFSHSISTSSASNAEAAAKAAPVEGDVAKLIASLDEVLSAEGVTGAVVADAAVTLTYLQVKGNRRIWGKVFEKAAAVATTFDAASLSNFMWAASTAEVTHFKTLFELSAPATALMSKFTPTQLSIVVEGLGKAGSADLEFFSTVSKTVIPKVTGYKAADLTRLLSGFAYAGVADVAFAKAVSGALAGKTAEMGPREVAQALWAMAKLRRTDAATIDLLSKAVKGKTFESPVDAAAAAWACAFLSAKPDAGLMTAAAASLKAGAASLSTEHAIQAAWALALTGEGKDALTALYSAISAVVDKTPEDADVYALATLSEALCMAPSDAVKPSVATYVHKVYELVTDAQEEKQSKEMAAFKADVATATAYALGARYRPDIAKAVDALPVKAGHVAVDISADMGGTKVAVVAVGPHYLSSSAAPLGPALAIQKVLESKKYKVVLVPMTAWAPLTDIKSKAKYILTAMKGAAPANKVAELMKAVDAPFDAYN